VRPKVGISVFNPANEIEPTAEIYRKIISVIDFNKFNRVFEESGLNLF
jgi:hypothetical protein